MIELIIPNTETLIKNYVGQFKYGAIHMENKDKETLRNIRTGEKIEISIKMPFLKDESNEYKTKGRISFISKNSIVFSFENTPESIELKEKIEKIVGNNKNNILYKQ